MSSIIYRVSSIKYQLLRIDYQASSMNYQVQNGGHTHSVAKQRNLLPFYKIHSLTPLNIMEPSFGHRGTLTSLRKPSWIFMDTQIDT